MQTKTHENRKVFREGTIVQAVAYSEDANLKCRPYMEDDFVIAQDVLKTGDSSLFGVMDGHGGSDTVHHVCKVLPGKFAQCYKKSTDGDMKKVFTTTLASIDKQLKLVGTHQNGCTVCLSFI